MSLGKNASPEFIARGAKDESIRQLPSESTPYPQHLPLFFVYTEKGPTTRLVLDSAGVQAAYGSKTLDATTSYFNHQSRFLRDALTYNASVMVQRIVPSDAGVKANATVYIDVLPTKIVNYERNSDGSLVPNEKTNDYEINMDNPVIDGYRVKYIKEYQSAGVEDKLGQYKTKPGTMVDPDTGKRSTMYPLFEIRAKYQGSRYNDIGFSIGSMYGDDVDQSTKDYNKSLPFKLTLYTRKDSNSTPSVLSTLYDEPYVAVSLKYKSLNPSTKERVDIVNRFDTQWFNETNTLLPLVYNDYEEFYFYDNYYEEVNKMFIESEAPYVTTDESVWYDGKESSTLSWFDYTSVDKNEMIDNCYLFNPFSCMSTKKVKYFTVQYDDGISTTDEFSKEINMSYDAPIFLSGGSDGTLDDEHYEEGVLEHLALYADENSEYMDLATNVESMIWDSGFSLKVKEEMTNFILVRKDTGLALSTHVASLGKKYYNLSDTKAIGTALKTRLRLCPESTYYGTPVARAIICMGAGKLRDGSDDERIPLTYSLLIKSCKMMGAADGKWKSAYKFDRVYDTTGSSENAGSLVTELIDIQPTYIPNSVKPSLWDVGLVWAQPFDRDSYHFPALQTIYENDTSVLNSYFSIIALSTVTKLAASVFREFTGTTGMTDDDFINTVNERLRAITNDIFADMLTAVPNAYMTEADKLRGYSWAMQCILYGTTMKTKTVYTSIMRNANDNNEASA